MGLRTQGASNRGPDEQTKQSSDDNPRRRLWDSCDGEVVPLNAGIVTRAPEIQLAQIRGGEGIREKLHAVAGKKIVHRDQRTVGINVLLKPKVTGGAKAKVQSRCVSNVEIAKNFAHSRPAADRPTRQSDDG